MQSISVQQDVRFKIEIARPASSVTWSEANQRAVIQAESFDADAGRAVIQAESFDADAGADRSIRASLCIGLRL